MEPVYGAFEARLAFGVALLASGLLHVGISLKATEPAPKEERIEISLVDAEGAREGGAAPEAEGGIEPVRAPHRKDEVEAAPSAPRHWRKVLAARERAIARDRAEQRQRLAALLEGALTAGPPRPQALAGSEEVALCSSRGAEAKVHVQKGRPLSGYADVLPRGLFPLAYAERAHDVRARKGGPKERLGIYEIALPAEVLPIPLDAPKNALVAVGRGDARCLIGFSWTRGSFFPLRFFRVPILVVDREDRVASAVVDVELFEDARFRLLPLEGERLPFAEGALYDQKAVARNLRQHYVGARALREVIGILFGP